MDPTEPDNREEESPSLGTIRGKCITQLLLLGAINSIQVFICLLCFSMMYGLEQALLFSTDSSIFSCLSLILQQKYWSNLKTAQKIAIMDILFSFIEFAASYNSYSNLRTRMNHIPAERFVTKPLDIAMNIFIFPHEFEHFIIFTGHL